MRRTLLITIALLALTAVPTFAQTWHVNCRRPAEVTPYEPSVTDVDTCYAFFSFHVQMGGVTAGNSNLVWTHDGQGWTPTPNPLTLGNTPASGPNCNPYVTVCPPPGHYQDTPVAPPAPFEVGKTYQEPYNGRIVITAQLMHQTGDHLTYWVGECLNATGAECLTIGHVLTLESTDRARWNVPAQP